MKKLTLILLIILMLTVGPGSKLNLVRAADSPEILAVSLVDLAKWYYDENLPLTVRQLIGLTPLELLELKNHTSRTQRYSGDFSRHRSHRELQRISRSYSIRLIEESADETKKHNLDLIDRVYNDPQLISLNRSFDIQTASNTFSIGEYHPLEKTILSDARRFLFSGAVEDERSRLLISILNLESYEKLSELIVIQQENFLGVYHLPWGVVAVVEFSLSSGELNRELNRRLRLEYKSSGFGRFRLTKVEGTGVQEDVFKNYLE